MDKIKQENVPCRHYCSWTEYGQQFADCSYEGDLPENGDCNTECPAYKPMEIGNCEKHGDFIIEYGCDSCMADDYRQAIEGVIK